LFVIANILWTVSSDSSKTCLRVAAKRFLK
jgi:hypothetical protein